MLIRRIGVLSRSLLSLLPCGIGASERVALSCHTIAGEGASRVPLSGIRVVDLTRILAGPFCTMMLADMGAEVIKVETPGQGDPLRGQGVIKDGLSWYFAAFNRNKRSLSLNLRSEAGRAVLARLIARSDVLVENFRPGVPRRGQGVREGGLAWCLAAFNRNEGSLSLNLRSEAGGGVLARVIARRDVLVENFRPGVLAQMGFEEPRQHAGPKILHQHVAS